MGNALSFLPSRSKGKAYSGVSIKDEPVGGVQKDKALSRELKIRILKDMMQLLWPKNKIFLRFLVVLTFVVIVLTKLVGVMIPLTYKYTIDGLSKGSFPLHWIVLYSVFRTLNQFLTDSKSVTFYPVSENTRRTTSTRTLRHLHCLSLRFHLTSQTGTVVRAIERGTSSLNTMYNMICFTLFPTALELVLTCGALFYLSNWFFGIAIFVTIMVYAIFTFSVAAWRKKFRRQMNESDGDAAANAVDSLMNAECVKLFAAEELESARYEMKLKEYAKSGIKVAATLGLLNTGQSFIMSVGLLVVNAASAWAVYQGDFTVGDYVMIAMYLLQLYGPLGWLGTSYSILLNAMVDLEKLYSILGTEVEVKDVEGALPLEVRGGSIVFSHVSLTYDAADDKEKAKTKEKEKEKENEEEMSMVEAPIRWALHNVSFTVEPGTVTAFVGHSGAGKTTLVRLLFRLYDISEGEISIDDQNIAEVTQHSLRQSMAIIPQDPALFNATLRYNIKYGDPEATDEAMHEACRKAQIHEFICNLDDGYDTIVGERGMRLSGGERQRIAIARAILKNPRIVIQDEATSALDTITERAIQESMHALSEGRTTLVIAHRLSTIAAANQIIVLEHGEVIEVGNHEELLELGGVYASMWNEQIKANEQPSA